MTAFLIRINRETGKHGAEKDWTLDTSCQLSDSWYARLVIERLEHGVDKFKELLST